MYITTETIIVIAYLFIGIILAYIWWDDEYKDEYEYEKDNNEVEEPMAILMLLAFTVFWPIKLIKNFFENLFLS